MRSRICLENGNSDVAFWVPPRFRVEDLRFGGQGTGGSLPASGLAVYVLPIRAQTARRNTRVSLTPDSGVLRDQICTTSGPKVNCVMQVDF